MPNAFTGAMEAPEKIDIQEEAFSRREELEGHLAWKSFLALAGDSGRRLIVDRSLRRREMKAGFLLAAAWMLSRRLREWTEGDRVGIVFPPGLGGYLANLSVVLAGKVPVNLNFTLGEAAARSCLRRAGIDCLLTAPAVRAKLAHFPWPAEGVVDLVDAMKGLSKPKTLALLAAIRVLPGKWLAGRLGVPREGGAREAGLLFTSGSSGEPKGVALTHRNILANCAQIDTSGLLAADETVLANLPIFHSFGFTVTLWYPLLRGCRVVAVPSPLETRKNVEAIEAEKVSVLIGTPTFLKPYFKRAEPKQMASLRYVVAGAEKTPDGFAERWESTFGGSYLEGYGLTETSPVLSVNLPHPPQGAEYPGESRDGKRIGSVGRLLPGIAARILHPETRRDLPVKETGLLAVKGANVFGGYLDDPGRTAEVKEGEWFVTGDLARFDEDGFLYIEGRLSRFSKIGGEMVPHGAVEDLLNRAFDLEDAESPMLAVAGRADEAKGEVLVLLAAFDIEPEAVRKSLTEAGFGNLWIPREIKRVEAIPTLAAGKLDLRAIQELAAR